MTLMTRWRSPWNTLLGTLLCLTFSTQSSQAQSPTGSGQIPQVTPGPQVPYSGTTPDQLAIPSAPEVYAPDSGGGFATPPAPAPAPPAVGSPLTGALAPGEFGAGGGGTYALAATDGYLDSAIIRSRFRIRYDAAYENNNPDRAEFIYAKCGCFNNPALAFSEDPRIRALYDRRALGPSHPNSRPGAAGGGESRVDFQEVVPYLEYAPVPWFSGFIEMPARFINPQLNANAYGWSDLNLGFKYAFIANPNQYLTFQFRTYVPTGGSERGLGTNHASLEPGLLYFQRLGDRLLLSAELRDWIPVHATDFGGNVLRYGIGLAYNVVETSNVRVAPVAEFVGWSILSGKQTTVTGPESDFPNNFIIESATDTIVNAKFGVRIGLGDYLNPGGGSNLNDRHSLYIGYGRSLTGPHWYRNILRAEYSFWF